MRWPLGTRQGLIGLDVGRRLVKAAQMRRVGRNWRLEAVGHFPRPGADGPIDRSLALQIRDVLARQGFVGRRLAVAVPRDRLLSATLELPPRESGAPVDQLARLELARQHNRDPESVETALWDLPATGRAPQACQVMAFACGHSDAEGPLDVLESAGFDVRVMDVPACALARVCAPLVTAASELTAILDIGWQAVWLAFLCRGTPIYERNMGHGGASALAAAVQKRFGLDGESAELVLTEVGLEVQGGSGRLWHDRAGLRSAITGALDPLVTELDASVRYVAQQFAELRLQSLLLVGGGAVIPGLAGLLSDALAVQVRVVRPGDVAACKPAILPLAANPALLMAVGLAGWERG